MDEIFHRVSIRKYKNMPIEPDKVEQLIRAAMAAPSAGNQQPWEFYVVTNRSVIRQLADTSPYAGCAGNAPVVIVTVYREDVISPMYAQIDLSIACENMWLEADSLGLGGVWLGIAPLKERMDAVQKIINLPEGQHAFSLFALGYPAETKVQQDRFFVERIHHIK